MKQRPPPFVPTYQFTPEASKNNAFCFAYSGPSIFMGYRAFVANVHGESASQVATRTVERYELRHGRSSGTISGLSERADELLGEETYTRSSMRAKARAA